MYVYKQYLYYAKVVCKQMTRTVLNKNELYYYYCEALLQFSQTHTFKTCVLLYSHLYLHLVPAHL